MNQTHQAGYSFWKSILFFIILCILQPVSAVADDITLVSWNASPAFYEGIELRKDDFKSMAEDLNPDVIVLVEVGGNLEAKIIADSLGWEKYYAVASNQSIARTSSFQALESAVISKIPITGAVEYDPQPDGSHEIFTRTESNIAPVSEVELTADKIKGFGQSLAKTDRGTLRVDLANGISIFTAHLKSNRNNECFDLSDSVKFMKKHNFEFDSKAELALESGFEGATQRRLTNAEKRERVAAAIAREAAVVDEGRTVLIAGDFNTAFEEGKYGQAIEDCELKNFSCAKAPFPSSACQGADGFDDTLGIFEAGLIANKKWTVVSKNLGRTYKDKKFADAAIDHVIINETAKDFVQNIHVSDSLYGSDHFPVVTVLTLP